MSENELRQLHNKLETLLGQSVLDGLYFCPHHPDKGFEGERPELKIDCGCRKPKIGLIKEAVEELNIDGACACGLWETPQPIFKQREMLVFVPFLHNRLWRPRPKVQSASRF